MCVCVLQARVQATLTLSLTHTHRGANALQARVQAIDDSMEDEVSMVRYNAREYVTHMTGVRVSVCVCVCVCVCVTWTHDNAHRRANACVEQ